MIKPKRHNRSYFIHFVSNAEGSGFQLTAAIAPRKADINAPHPETFMTCEAKDISGVVAQLFVWNGMTDSACVRMARRFARMVDRALAGAKKFPPFEGIKK